MAVTKTPATVLQEMMVKLGTMPEYECVTQSGPQHSAMFEYRCFAQGNTVRAAARSKKEAKQEAARAMLACLAEQGYPVPAHYRRPPTPQDPVLHFIYGTTKPQALPKPETAAAAPLGARSHVVLLRDLCEEYKLPAPEYTLVGDTGPPHCRQFTLRAAVGRHERRATATTKKAARQLAADQLYTYLRENLARLTKDYVEEEALARAHEKVMERYMEVRDEADWRPDLGQRVADYHLGLLTHVDEDKRNAAVEALGGAEAGAGAGAGAGAEAEAEAAVTAAAAALGLTATWSALPAAGAGAGAGAGADPLALLELAPASPALAFAGRSRAQAAAAAARYLRRALPARPARSARSAAD